MVKACEMSILIERCITGSAGELKSWCVLFNCINVAMLWDFLFLPLLPECSMETIFKSNHSWVLIDTLDWHVFNTWSTLWDTFQVTLISTIYLVNKEGNLFKTITLNVQLEEEDATRLTVGRLTRLFTQCSWGVELMTI